MILSWIVSAILKSKFKKYSKIPVDNGMSGRDVAERMLRDNGIFDVKVESVQRTLTDHYNPENKTINLSPEVYNWQKYSCCMQLLLMKPDMQFSMQQHMPGLDSGQNWYR